VNSELDARETGISSLLFVRCARFCCLGDPNIRARLRSLHVRKALKGTKSRTILDAGCGRSGAIGWHGGIAPIAYPLSRFLRESNVTGYDRDPEIVDHNIRCLEKSGANNLAFEVANFYNSHQKAPYDAVVCSDIARDPSRDAHLFQSLARLVRPRGYLIAIVPSNRKLVFNGWFRREETESGFRRDELESILTRSGFNVKKIVPIIGSLSGAAATLASRIALSSYPLLILVFPFLMALAMPDTIFQPKGGDAVLAVATREDR